MSEKHHNLDIKPLLGNSPTVVNIDATEETPSNTQRLVNQGAEATDVNVNLNRTITYNTAAPATQRSVRIQAPTLASTAATTITTASTVDIGGAPVAGTNVTITTPLALNVAAGKTRFAAGTTAQASINIPSGTAPTSPVVGDIWQTTDGFYLQTGAGTIGPISGTVGYYGLFTSQTDQAIQDNAETLMTFDTAESANGVSIDTTDDYKIKFANAGTYTLLTHINVIHSAGGAETVSLWIKKNGSNVANSAKMMAIQGNGEYDTIETSWTVVANANDYISIAMAGTDTDLTAEHSVAQTTPYARPAIPSVTLLVTQVVDTSVLISGAINLDGGHPNSIYGGTPVINCGGVT